MYDSELLVHIAELEARNRVLVDENNRLREALGLPLEEIAHEEPIIEPVILDDNYEIQATLPFINKYSSPQEKIELFMSLFRGRTDVYAKRCYRWMSIFKVFPTSGRI